MMTEKQKKVLKNLYGMLYGEEIVPGQRLWAEREIERINKNRSIYIVIDKVKKKNTAISLETAKNIFELDLEIFKNLKNVIAVARGVEKTEAIIAISKLNPNLVLVTDEQTAKRIQEVL